MDSLFDIVRTWINMQDGHSNIVSNTSIRNNNNRFGIQWYVCEKWAALLSLSL